MPLPGPCIFLRRVVSYTIVHLIQNYIASYLELSRKKLGGNIQCQLTSYVTRNSIYIRKVKRYVQKSQPIVYIMTKLFIARQAYIHV